MRCKNCNTVFDVGMFCPECGIKYCADEKATNDYEKAHNILDKYGSIEEEKKTISKMGWPNDSDVRERIVKRLNIYEKISKTPLQEIDSLKKVDKMKEDIKKDYNELLEKDCSLGGQVFWAVVVTYLSISFLIGKGLGRTIIGGIVIWAGWAAVVDLIKTKNLLSEIKPRIKDL